MPKILVSLLLLAAIFAQAQVTQEVFESYKLQEKRDIQYYFPEHMDDTKKYPIIVVLDAEFLFDEVVASSKFYSRFHSYPESIIVGINQNKNNLRYADCDYELDSGLPTNKGKAFYEFIGLELIPYIETNYNTAPFKMIFGYDITANFQNYWLFKEASFFDAYISISPILAPEMETRVPARLESFDKDIFYQLIVEEEPSKHTQKIGNMHKDIEAIEKESLHYYFDTYDTANHISIVTYGIGKSFDNIFNIFKPISPKEYKTKILTSEGPVYDYLQNKYQLIEDLFGFSKPIELNDIIAIYAASRKKEDFESLKPLSELCKKEYPETMLGFYFEGEYYEQLGEPKKALITFEKAFQMKEIDFLTKDMALNKIDALKEDFGF